MATGNAIITYTCNVQRFTAQVQQAITGLQELAAVIERNRDYWRCISPGEWPDKFTLLNRYVRTGLEPTYIFND